MFLINIISYNAVIHYKNYLVFTKFPFSEYNITIDSVEINISNF